MSHAGTLPPQTFGYIGQGQLSTPAPLSVTTEATLFHAYAHGQRVCPCHRPEPERCACGDWIAPASAELIEEAVAYHNESRRHVSWRTWRERGNG